MAKKENQAVAKRVAGWTLLALLVCAAVTSCAPVTGFSNENGDAKITKLVINGIEGAIDEKEKIIEVVLPLETDVTALLPKVEFVGTNIDPDPAREEFIDFSRPVTYTVFSKDGNDISYMVLVTLKIDKANRITAFTLDDINAVSVNIAEEDEDYGIVYAVVPPATSLSGRTAKIVHTGISISPDGNVPQDLSQPVTYTVASGQGNERVYTVIVTDNPNTENDITSFMIDGVPGSITGTEITVRVPSTALLAAVKPVMQVSLGATVEPDKNTARNFTNPVSYQVTSASGVVKTYRVTVNRMQSNEDADFPTGTVIQDPFTVSNTTEWDNAVNIIRNGGKDKNYVITVVGDFDVVGSKSSTILGPGRDTTFGDATGMVVIRGSQTIGLSSTGSLLFIGANQSVVLRDIALKGRTDHLITVVGVENGGSFEMRGDAKITGNKSNHGGGVTVDDATFTMRDNASVFDNSANFGGGVSVVRNGIFIMRDNASVSGNTCLVWGGGVYVSYGTFTMRDNALVSGNTVTPVGFGGFGGGISVHISGTFRIAGGTVYGSDEVDGLKNTAPDGAALDEGGNTAEYGTGGTDGVAWVRKGTLSKTDDTIKVVNGIKR